MKTNSIITKVTLPGLVIVALALFGSSAAWAQSSGGNFTASVDTTVCSVNSMSNATAGALTFTSNSGGGLTATIKLPNSSPGLLVTPSLVTGLYTNTLASGSGTSTSNETAAIVVVVTDTLQPSGPTKTLTPAATCVDTSAGGTATCPDTNNPDCKCGVVYDERFQQLTTMNLMSNESIDLILSTLSAHSFNFTEANIAGGIHKIDLTWYFGCDNGTGTLHTAQCRGSGTTLATIPNAAACVGPGSFTVTQVQQFQHSSPIQPTGQ